MEGLGLRLPGAYDGLRPALGALLRSLDALAELPRRRLASLLDGVLRLGLSTLSTVVLATIFYAVVMVMIRIFLARDMDVML